MLSKGIIKVLSVLPEGWVVKFAKVKLNNYVKRYADINVDGLETLEDIKGAKIFVCNHLSNSDALILAKVLKAEDPTFVAGVKLTENPVTSLGTKVIKHINIKPNSADKDAIVKMVNLLRNNGNLMIFPEGTRSRNGAMIEGKKGVVLVARMSKANIIPISMWGSEKLLPISKKEDMAAEKWHHAKVNVKIGRRVELPSKEENEDKHKYDERCLDCIMKSIAYNLPDNYKGKYK